MTMFDVAERLFGYGVLRRWFGVWTRDGNGRFALPKGVVGALMLILTVAGCAAPPQSHALRTSANAYDPKLGVRASPKLVEDGQPVPHGGGVYMVGRPYVVGGRTYYPSERPYSAVGTASWYGDAFHGRQTANGEIFDKGSLAAAHPTMPLPSYARITNLLNGHSVIVRVNDRGPYAAGRVMDVSERVADVLEFKRSGTAHVKVEYVGRAGLAGSDDERLLATLRTDGTQARLDGAEDIGGTQVAEAPLLYHERKAGPFGPPQVARVAQADPGGVTVAVATPPRPSPPPLLTARNAPLPPTRPFKLGLRPREEMAALAALVAKPAPTAPPVRAAHLLRGKPLRRPDTDQTD